MSMWYIVPLDIFYFIFWTQQMEEEVKIVEGEVVEEVAEKEEIATEEATAEAPAVEEAPAE